MGWLDWLLRRRTPDADIAPRPVPEVHPDDARDGWVVDQHGWQRRPITIEEAETQNPGLAGDSRAERYPHIVKPFGFQSAEWEALKSEMQPGDVLEEFMSSRDSWAHLAGRAGIRLVRNGETLAEIVTLMN